MPSPANKLTPSRLKPVVKAARLALYGGNVYAHARLQDYLERYALTVKLAPCGTVVLADAKGETVCYVLS